jgi:transcriptional regulator with XRE-family HTH domain
MGGAMIKSIIGQKLKATRLKNDMTIQELAKRAAVSSNMISRIERGLTTPSVEILMRLASSFGMSMNFFVEEAEKGSTLVHTLHGQGEPIFFFEDKHQIFSLTQGIRDPGFSVFIDILEEGCNSGEGGMVHSGEEFAYVLEGSVVFFVDEEEYLVNVGDSIAFKASRPHRWKNLSQGRSQVLWVVSPAPSIAR